MIEVPVCRAHGNMSLMKGLHRESGGFVDNYWCCGRGCNYTVPARNREEAEMQTPAQNFADRDPEEFRRRSDEFYDFIMKKD